MNRTKKRRVNKLKNVAAGLTARWTWLRDELTRRRVLFQGESGGDETERAMSELEASNQTSTSEVLRNEMVQIEAALGRINLETYGYCADCDGEISERRLKAKPDATKCLKCQEQIEKTPPQRRATDVTNY